jgi:glyoxylase-like metal-dependent hydrolase (beta-lactamase superfamily II)
LRGPRIPDGGWIQAGDVRMQVLATPGHSPDHACLWDPAARIIFAGDLLVSSGTVMIDATSGGGLGGYLASLKRMRELEPLRVYPGHGPVIDDVTALIDQYISHRLDRERQVLAALQAAPATIAALVQSIYPLLDPAVAPAAEETLLAHLRKLQDDGKVRRAGEVWMLTTNV